MPIEVFGAGAVQTAYVSFSTIDITQNDITLVWPTSYFDVPSFVGGIHYDVLPASLNVTNGNANVHTVTLPNAMESSVGSNFIIKNAGLSSFRLLKSNGIELLTIPNAPETSNTFWVQLIDNTTPEGGWQTIQFGAGISQAQAAGLVGNGLVSLLGLLNTNISVKPIANSPYQVLVGDRAKLILWQTGAGQLTLPDIVDSPNGFYFSFNNEGSGVVTVSGDATIDNQASITVSPGQSLSFISDGVKWWSLGFGQNIASSNFAPGSSLAPSITFTTDPATGIYYYQAPFPPVAPPGIGFSVSSSQIANLSLSGLYMNAGKDIILQDQTNVSQTKIKSDANYGRFSWTSPGLLNDPTLDINGTNTQSTLTLGPFATLSFSQSDVAAVTTFNGNNIWIIDDTGASAFINNVSFQNTSTFTLTATFNGPVIFNQTSTFNGAASFNNTVTLSSPLTIANGGTGQNSQQSAINALMSPAPAIGDLMYYDATNNWVRLPIGNVGEKLTVVLDGANLVPQWQI